MQPTYYGIHNHTMYSNTRFADAINSVKGLIINARRKGLAGISISEHQSLASHEIAEKDLDELCRKHPKEYSHFRLTYGDEIYLVNRDEVEAGRKRNREYHRNHCQGNYKYTGFYHFVLTAKDAHGYELLRRINAQAWRDSFRFGRFKLQRRLPTYKDWLSKIMPEYRGDVIVSTACLGSELSKDLMKLNHDENTPVKPDEATGNFVKGLAGMLDDNSGELMELTGKYMEKKRADNVRDDQLKIRKFIEYLERTFEKSNVYFELMPSLKKAQKTVNRYLVKLSEETGIKTIISTDAHFGDADSEGLHREFLQAEEARRDVYDFYHYARLFSYRELACENDQPKFRFFSDDVLKTSAQNSLELLKRIEPFRPSRVPKTSSEEKSMIKKNAFDAKRINRQVGHQMVGHLHNVIHTIKNNWYGMD